MPTPQSSKLLRAQAPGNTDTSVSLYLMAPTLGLKGLSGERGLPEKQHTDSLLQHLRFPSRRGDGFHSSWKNFEM